MKKDIIRTLITQFIVLFATFIIYKFIMEYFGELEFAQYSMIKRYTALLTPVFILALMITIPKFIAFRNSYAKLYLSSSAYLLSITSFILLLITYFLNEELAILFFKNTDDTKLVIATVTISIAYMWHTISYGYFRGLLKMNKANYLSILNLAMLPLLMFFISNNFIQYMYYLSIAVFSISIIIIFLILRKPKKLVKLNTLNYFAKKMFYYGVARVPGNVGQMLLFSIPILIATKYYETTTVGYMAFSISLVAMTSSFFTPISLVLLPNASIVIKEKKFDLLKEYFIKLTIFISIILIIGVSIFQIFTDIILSLVIKEENISQVVETSQLVFWSTFGFSFFVVLRVIIEAYYFKAKNTYNILYSIVIYFLSYLFLNIFEIDFDILIALVISFSFLGIKSFLDCLYIFRKEI